MHAALGDAFRHCEFYAEPNCCHAITCKRIDEFERAGYRLFLQKSHDYQLLDPVPRAVDLILVQIREPTLRALSKYENDLQSRGGAHSIEYLQLWLAEEALYVVDFWRKWVASEMERRLVLRFEHILAAPRESLGAILSAIGLVLEDGDVARAVEKVKVSPEEHLTETKARMLETSPYFSRPCFVEFMNIVAQEIDYMGYPTWQERKPPTGPVTTIYRAKRALAEQNYDEALSLLGPLVAIHKVRTEIRAMLGVALLGAGREAEGRRALEVLLQLEPEFFDGYAILAKHAYEAGAIVEGRGYLREATARLGGVAQARDFLQRQKFDPDFLREMPAEAALHVPRESVIGGFRWILGRRPESDAVIEDHRHLPDDDALRLALLRSQEFKEFFERFETGHETPPVAAEPPVHVSRDDVLSALRWLLGRPLQSKEEIDGLLTSESDAELRLRLVGTDEFKQLYHGAAEAR